MPTNAPAPDALRSALEKALPCYDDHEGPPVCRPTHSHDCPAHLRGKVYAAVAPLLAKALRTVEVSSGSPVGKLLTTVDELRAALAAERAAREAAERDTERLDWLATVPLERIEEIYWGSEGDNGITREAIDAARSAVAKGDEG